MTPSEAHDSAWKREPSHDEMTLSCLRAMRLNFQSLRWREYKTEHVGTLSQSRAEALCSGGHGKPFFADILLRWDFEEEQKHTSDKRRFSVYGAYEIKPKIYSVGAILRQVEMQKLRLTEWAQGGFQKGEAFVDVIVKADDPLVELLVNLGERSVLTWDGSKISRRAK